MISSFVPLEVSEIIFNRPKDTVQGLSAEVLKNCL